VRVRALAFAYVYARACVRVLVCVWEKAFMFGRTQVRGRACVSAYVRVDDFALCMSVSARVFVECARVCARMRVFSSAFARVPQ
jgi:hypothetical protein